MRSFYQSRKQTGFTILEILVVLIIIGIISVMIIGRSHIGQVDLLSQTEVIKSHIRYAQSRAMNSDRTWGIELDSTGKSYWLYADGNPPKKIRLPGQDTNSVDLSALNLALTPVSITVSFDDRGRPCADNKGTILRATDLSLTLTADGGASTTVLITRNTGFVP
jgi:MSHA pilin protein MshC